NQQFFEGIERRKADADQPDMFRAPAWIDDDGTSEVEERSADSLVEHRAAGNGHGDADTAGAWPEQQRAAAWEGALASVELGGAGTIARPHWLPLPQKHEQQPKLKRRRRGNGEADTAD